MCFLKEPVLSNLGWRNSFLDLADSELSLDVILSMISEKDFKDLDFCKRLIKRAFQEGNMIAIKGLLNKASAVFVFSTEGFRREIVEYLYSKIKSWTFETILEIGKESILGNVLSIYYFIERIGVVTPEGLDAFSELANLAYIEDPLIFDYVPTKRILVLDLNIRLESISNFSAIERAIKVCELFFFNGKMERSKDTIAGIALLYEKSQQPERKFKANIVSALLGRRLDMFTNLVNKIYSDVEDENGLIRHYAEIYDWLAGAKVPIFFDFNNFRLEFDKFYNGNFYLARILDKSGKEHLLFPFEQTDAAQVQQIFDLGADTFVTPIGRTGKILLQSIYSFRRVREIAEVAKEQIEIIRGMSDNEIGEKIREILQDQNITSHGPAEKVDVYQHKLFVNNENDLRDAGIIIKGKGYSKITLGALASNILKAVDLPIQIIFLVHTGILLDEAREKFVNQCDRAKKMHCIIDPVDLTKLLVAYNRLPSP